MLRRGIAIAIVGIAAAAIAQEDNPDGIHSPVRVTAGVADQLLGQLGSDGHTLYYVTNAEASTEVFALDIRDGRSHKLFDEGAEATWPRPSPDGRSVLYISYRDQAAGQLCIRALPSAGQRRCLADSGALQAEWIDDHAIALVERTGQGDVQMVRVTSGDHLTAAALVSRTVTSPAVSPDGRWLVYIPIDRDVSQVGADFAAHAAAKLEIAPVANPAAPHSFAFELPGVSAQPSFSRDGHFLYFVQFLTDTNQDGLVDAADHGVLFRVPFDPSKPALDLGSAIPEQLTDGSWNCQYPFAGREKLYATCAQGDTLDVFELPLAGEVPEGWNNDRVRVEVELATETSEQLLLYRRMITRARTAAGHSLGLMRMVSLHLDRAEFQAALFYAEEATAKEDPAVRGLGRRLVAWVEQRRQGWEREHGREISGFAAKSRERFDALNPDAADTVPAVVLGHLVRSDIALAIGDFDLARAELEAVELPADAPKPLLELTFRSADRLYRLLDDSADLLRWCRRLATFPKAAPDLQLRFARAYVRTLLRGRGPAAAQAALAKDLAEASPQSELAFALQLAQTIATIQDDKVDQHGRKAKAAVLALYAQETRSDRRHVLVADAIARANELHVDQVIEGLAEKYIADTQPGTAEHQRAELLYRHALLGRAFRRRARSHYPEARADFKAVMEHTHALDAVVGWIDLGLRAEEKPEAIAAELEASSEPKMVKVFGRVYLQAHDLRNKRGKAHAEAVEQTVALLRSDWSELHGQRLARALYGALRQESFVETGDLVDAERAATHYEIAYKGLRSNIRLKAMLLSQLGLLHTDVGNYRLALSYLDQREKYPYIENTAGLAVRLARARALLHIGNEAEAATVADEAVAMTSGAPKLAPYRKLALDRAALYNLAAGRFDLALKHYDEELSLLGGAVDPGANAGEGLRNSLVVRLGHAAAALGAKRPEQTLQDIAAVQRGLSLKAAPAALQWKHATAEQSMRSYQSILAGLEANALLELGRPQDAAVALAQRQALLETQFKETQRDADARALTLVEDRLAAREAEVGDAPHASSWARRALENAEGFGALVGLPLPVEQADALWEVGELTALGGEQDTGIATRLRSALDTMASRDESSWEKYRHWFELCLTLQAPLAETRTAAK